MILFQPFPFNLCVSLGLMSLLRQHRAGYFFFFFNPFKLLSAFNLVISAPLYLQIMQEFITCLLVVYHLPCFLFSSAYLSKLVVFPVICSVSFFFPHVL